jgi:hypothetical protein
MQHFILMFSSKDVEGLPPSSRVRLKPAEPIQRQPLYPGSHGAARQGF